jgi:hypothetical protein
VVGVRRRWPACALVVAIGSLRSEDARADPSPLPLELTWNAPTGCPDAQFVIHRVEQLVRGPLAATSVVLVNARIEHASDGQVHLALTLRTDGVEETRALEGASCSALAEASAVVIALAIDPSATHCAVPAEPMLVPPPDPGPSEPRSSEPPILASIGAAVPSKIAPSVESTPSTAPATRAWRVALGLGGAMNVGPLPAPGAGVAASATVRLNRFRVGLLGTLWSRQSPRFSESGGASFEMLEVGAFGGYMVPVGALAFGPCATVEATYMNVQGVGIRAPRASSKLWPTALLGGRLEARFASWGGLFSHAEALLPLGAPIYTLGTVGDAVHLHQPSRVGLRLSLGVEIVLP